MQVKAGIGGEVVKIGHDTFHSPFEVEAWIIKNRGHAGTLEEWVDVVSMLELLSECGNSVDSHMDLQAKARKAGFANQEEGRLVNSFRTVIPTVFNSAGNKKEPFSAISKYEEFDCEDGTSGFVNSLDESINLWEQHQTNKIQIYFPEESMASMHLLAAGFQQKSVNFWRKFTSWVTKFYNRLTGIASRVKRGNTLAEIKEQDASLKSTREGAWKLVLKVMKDIFLELAIRRSGGEAAANKEKVKT